MLIDQKKTISSMESCTGGGLANAITNIPHASEVFSFTAVTYSNDFKEKTGVNPAVIEQYTVYSRETADEMSTAISNFANSSYGVGITGQLLRQDPNNPVGEDDKVYISVYDRENQKTYNKAVTVVYETREENKALVIAEVADLVKKVMTGDYTNQESPIQKVKE